MDKPARGPIVLRPGDGRTYAMGGMRAVFKADEDDAFHVLEGTMSFLINGQWVGCPPGSFVMAPAGCVNDFQNRGSVRAGVLNLSAPGAASARWRTHGPPSTRPGRALRPIAAGHDRSR